MRSSLCVACDEKPSCYLRIITNTVSSALLDERVTGGLGKGVVCRAEGEKGKKGRKETSTWANYIHCQRATLAVKPPYLVSLCGASWTLPRQEVGVV